MTILENAELIARFAHRNQKRNDGKPYITHPEAVAKSVEGVKLKTIAWLHDVLEDTECTAMDLLECEIPFNWIRAIQAMSREKGENYFHFILRCGENDFASRVKLADLAHNMSDLKEGSMKDKYRFADLYLTMRLDGEF